MGVFKVSINRSRGKISKGWVSSGSPSNLRHAKLKKTLKTIYLGNFFLQSRKVGPKGES